MSRRSRRSGWILRLALGLTALSLWAYIPYRYAVRPPVFDGFIGAVYAILFPLSALLALGALAVAWRPAIVSRLRDTTLKAVGVFGGAWLLMGFLCVPRLTALTAVEPVKGSISMVHMTAQHVFLGVMAMAVAWLPQAVVSILLGRPPSDAMMATERPLPTTE